MPESIVAASGMGINRPIPYMAATEKTMEKSARKVPRILWYPGSRPSSQSRTIRQISPGGRLSIQREKTMRER